MEQPRFSPIPESFPPSWKKKDKQKERPVPFGPSYITYLTQLAPQVLCRLIRASFASRGKAARNSTETCQRGETENWDVNTGSWDVFPGLVHFCHTAAAGRRKKGRKWGASTEGRKEESGEPAPGPCQILRWTDTPPRPPHLYFTRRKP